MSGAPQSPSMLPPPPKRAPGVRRLNNVPKLILFVVGLAVVGGFMYSYRARYLQTTAITEQAADHKPEAASGANVTANRPRPGELMRQIVAKPTPPGAVQDALAGAGTVPNPMEPTPTYPTATSNPSTGGEQAEDMATKARRDAWAAYYAQVVEVQRARVEAAREALKADTSLASSATGGTPSAGGLDQRMADAQAGVQAAQAAQAGYQHQAAAGYGGGGYGGMGAMPPAMPDPSGARQKQAFAAQPGNLGRDDVLMASVRPQLTPFTVTAGDAILAIAITGATSDAPGQFVARVHQTVYDSATGLIPLIPQDSKIIGHANTEVSAGQSRLPMAITSIKFPDGSSLPLGNMPAADRSGFAGLTGKVDRHLWEKFGNALLLTLPGAAIQLGVGGGGGGYGGYGGYNAQQVAAASVSQQIAQLAQEQARQGLSIPNTIAVEPGSAFVVMLTKDIVLSGPYRDRRVPTAPGINVSMPIMQ